MKALLVLLLVFSPLSLGSSQAPKKVAIFITATSEDRVGLSLLYHFKEAVNRSSRYALEPADFRLGDKFMYVSLVSVKTDDTQSMSAISVIAQKQYDKCTGVFFHEALIVGTNRAEEMANGILADMDRDFSK